MLYQIGVSILVGADLAYFLLIPSSPLGRFVLDLSAPTTRIMRNNFLNELDHFSARPGARGTAPRRSPRQFGVGHELKALPSGS